MNNIVKRKAYLITRYMKGALTATEMQELEQWIDESEDNRELFESLTDPDHLRAALQRYEEKKEKMLNRVQASIALNKIRQPGWWHGWGRCAALAAVVVILFTGAWHFMNKNTLRYAVTSLPERYHNDVLPGSEQAKLILDEGTVIILLDTVNGVLATEACGHTQVFKENGWLSYYSSDPDDTAYFNTVQVPRKGEYKVLLPDGSRVWLNAGSTLRYPVVFGKERRVELQGEAYFEVTSVPGPIPGSGDLSRTMQAGNVPFIVDLPAASGKARLQATGARFNINAYADEAHIQATVLEGSIQLRKGANELLLKPRQQGLLEHNGQVAVLNNINTAAATAWKQGLFRFKDATIGEIMQQAERWYDIEVVYKESVHEVFTGTIERNTPLSQLLQYLEALQPVRFTITGNKITVMR